jgi:hypothetical protein
VSYKPWIVWGVAFVALALAVDAATTHWGIDENPSSDAGRLHHLFVESSDEIPIFGTSKVYYDYIPTEMGINAFNYGLDGSSYEVVDAFLAIELAKKKTSPIIIDLKPQGERGIGDVGTYIPVAFEPSIRRLLLDAHEMSWRFVVPGIRYFGYYENYAKEFINDRAQLARVVERGYSREKYWTFDRDRLDEAVRKRRLGPNGYFPDPDQDSRLIARIESHPERLFILVYSPAHRASFENFQNLEGLKAFQTRLAKLPNAVVIDMEQPDFPDEYFKDTSHLLPDGAVTFSRALGERIRAEMGRHASLAQIPQ